MKILLAVDDDTASFTAATAVADWFADDTSVITLHVGSVAGVATLASPMMVGGIGYPIVALPELRAEQERILRDAREIAERAARVTDGSPRTEAGDPAQKIVEVATEEAVDLIVVGTGDRSWLSRVITPSVSEEVIHNAPCPVLVVRRDEPDDDTDTDTERDEGAPA